MIKGEMILRPTKVRKPLLKIMENSSEEQVEDFISLICASYEGTQHLNEDIFGQWFPNCVACLIDAMEEDNRQGRKTKI